MIALAVRYWWVFLVAALLVANGFQRIQVVNAKGALAELRVKVADALAAVEPAPDFIGRMESFFSGKLPPPLESPGSGTTATPGTTKPGRLARP